MLADKVPSPARIHPRDVDRALALDEPHHAATPTYFGGIDQQHVHVIGHQMPLFHLALPLLRQTAEHRPQLPPQLPDTTPSADISE